LKKNHINLQAGKKVKKEKKKNMMIDEDQGAHQMEATMKKRQDRMANVDEMKIVAQEIEVVHEIMIMDEIIEHHHMDIHVK
jgi:hypothetical protein